jgi:DNA-binding NarL/FixJ family response regulator
MAARGNGGGALAPAAAEPLRPLSQQEMIKLFFVDSRILVREGLGALAEQQPDFAVIGGSGSATLGTAYETPPDVVVADVELPDAQGPDAISLLRKEFPDSALLVLTLVDHPAKVQQVLEAGADGYMLKTAPTRSSSSGSGRSRTGRPISSRRSASSWRGGTARRRKPRSTSTS